MMPCYFGEGKRSLCGHNRMYSAIDFQQYPTIAAPRRWALLSPGALYKRMGTLVRGAVSPYSEAHMSSLSADDAATLHTVGVDAIQSFVTLFVEAMLYSACSRSHLRDTY